MAKTLWTRQGRLEEEGRRLTIHSLINESGGGVTP